MTNYRALIAAGFAALALGTAPAFAGEGRGDPFPNATSGLTAIFGSRAMVADTGSEQPFDPAGRPGTGLRFSAELLPINGSNGPVQTANSAPTGFENGTVQSIQAQRVAVWQSNHVRPTPAIAVRQDGSGHKS